MSTSAHIKNILKHITAEPGVYRMLDLQGKIIYVGKATNLKNRVRSYFTGRQQSAKNKALIEQIHHIEITVTRSEKEALLLECTLINQLRPKYNILMRDDKSFPYIYIQQGHPYPRMKAIRLKNKPEKGHYFGPFPNASNLYATVHLLQTIFKLRNCQDADFAHRTRPCLQYQIKRCSAPCVQLISQQDYQKTFQEALLFLQGKQQDLFAEFQGRMEQAVSRLAYEEAALWRDKIKNLRMVQEQQAMISLQGDLDVVVVRFDKGIAGIIRVVIRDGKVLASDTFFPKIANMDWYGEEDDIWQALFSYFISYYYSEHPAQIPPMIITSRSVRDAKILLTLLQDEGSRNCRFHKPSSGQKKDWMAFAEHNLAQAMQSHHSSLDQLQERYKALSTFLNLTELSRMECFDVSHTQGDSTVASCVVFDRQGPVKKDYRRYNIQGVTAGDDYAAMRQVLLRRSQVYLKNPDLRPDLVVIDGGKGQVAVAKQVLEQLMLQGMTVIGISKGPSRKAGWEKLIMACNDQVWTLPPDNSGLHLLQHIRDEAHRFAITLHRQQRQKKSMGSSLHAIAGIGQARHKLLLQRFGGVRELVRASIEEIAKVPGIGYDLAKKIFDHFHGSST